MHVVRGCVVATTLLALFVAAGPTSAHTNAATCLLQGTASVSPGRFHTQLSNATWSFASALDICATSAGSTGVGADNVTGAGSSFGDCTAWIGSGSLRAGDHDVAATALAVGGTWVFQGVDLSSHQATVLVVMQTRALSTGQSQLPCITEPATGYLVVGVAVSAAVT